MLRRRRCVRSGDNPQGFTLVELVTVFAIVALLSTLVFGMGQRAQKVAQAAAAKAELAGISAALESYHRQFGDYPRTDQADELLQALIGRRAPAGSSILVRPLLGIASFRTAAGADPFTTTRAQLVDPWGKPYAYAYRSTLPWTNPTYVLYSLGSDGTAAELLTGGFIDAAANVNLDNVYGTE
jgi:general secretion pathway protein G